ncbi:hypothetical protein Ancab_000889 [Ancistrocladus abbreviatus]
MSMASATTRPTFSFHLTTTLSPQPKSLHLSTYPKHHKKPFSLSFSPSKQNHQHLLLHNSIPKSIDVSKEDKPISDEPDSDQRTPTDAPKFDKRRLEEKFAVLNTGIYECRSCGYRFDEAAGDPSYPIPPGLPFDRMPEDWRCPTCGAAKSFFESKSVEIAGFAQNQQFGFGTNTLTSGQKALLIWGGLSFFFVLFLLGYFLQ